MPNFVAEFVNPAKRSLWGRECLRMRTEKQARSTQGLGREGGGERGICERNEQEKENLPAFHLHCQIDIGWPSIYLRPPQAAEYPSNFIRWPSGIIGYFTSFSYIFQLSMHCRWSREVWDHVQMYKFTQGRGALELYSVFFAACHAKHVNLHFPIYFIWIALL